METLNMFIQNANPYIMIIGFIVIGYWQRHQIKALKDQITSQEGLIANLKMFNEIFDAKKVREYTRLSEEAIEKKKDMEIQEIKSELEFKIKSTTQTYEKREERTQRMVESMFETIFDLIVYVPPDSRIKVVDKNKDDSLKPTLKKISEIMPYYKPLTGNLFRDLDIRFTRNDSGLGFELKDSDLIFRG